jgi:hypothetical protein
MHSYSDSPAVNKKIKVDNPPYSDTIRLNNLCNNKYIPVGYTNRCVNSECSRIIEGDFSVLAENVEEYFLKKKYAVIGLMVVDFRMMPGPYGLQSYTKIEKSLVEVLFTYYEILSPTFNFNGKGSKTLLP